MGRSSVAQLICAGLCLLTTLTGCASKFPEANRTLEAPAQTYRVAPKQLVTMIREIVTAPPLSLGVEEEKDGSILTGYQPFPGDWHIGRRWQERTKYRITVIPDWNEPTAAARIDVRELTEQRAAEGMKWAPAFDLQRPERAKAMLAKLDEEIRRRSPAK
jgi:hypothetical protein